MDVLLIRDPLVHRDEGIEAVVGREAQQFSVGAPAQPICCTGRVPNDSGNADASRWSVIVDSPWVRWPSPAAARQIAVRCR